MRPFQFKAIFRASVLFVSASIPAPSISSYLAAQTAPQSPSASTATQPAPPSNPAPLAKPEQITVTAYRAPLGTLESPVTTRLLTTESLRSTAGITFDDQLRQLPGVELFRRSSSLVA